VPRSIICIKLEQSSGYSENRLQLTLYSHCRLLDQKISHNFFFKNVFNMLICEIYKITLKILQETLPNFYQLLSYFLQTWKVRVCDNTPISYDCALHLFNSIGCRQCSSIKSSFRSISDGNAIHRVPGKLLSDQRGGKLARFGRKLKLLFRTLWLWIKCNQEIRGAKLHFLQSHSSTYDASPGKKLVWTKTSISRTKRNILVALEQ